MISYWPGKTGFGFDPVGTIPDIINNSLAFLWEGKLDVLPALPKAWNKGEIRDILLRDQIQLKKLQWDLDQGKVVLELFSARDQEIIMRVPEPLPVKRIDVMKADIEEREGKANQWKVCLPGGTGTTFRISLENQNNRENSLP